MLILFAHHGRKCSFTGRDGAVCPLLPPLTRFNCPSGPLDPTCGTCPSSIMTIYPGLICLSSFHSSSEECPCQQLPLPQEPGAFSCPCSRSEHFVFLSESHSMWASVSSSSEEMIEPNYSSIEQLFCFPQPTPKEKTAAPAKAEPKEVRRPPSFFRVKIPADSSSNMRYLFFL